MNILRLSLALIVMFALLSGCATNNASSLRVATGDQPAITADPQVAATLAPPNVYRRELTRQAVRGLNYETGRVTIDQSMAKTLVDAPDPAAAALAYETGCTQLQHNRVIWALETMTRAVLLAPDQAQMYEGLGRVWYAKRNADKAAAAFRTALDLDPGLIEARFGLGIALEAQGLLDDAVAEYQELLRREPSHGLAHVRLATVLYFTGDQAAARDHIHNAETLATPVPSQLSLLLDGTMPEPRVDADQRDDAPQIGQQIRVDLGNDGASNETSIVAGEFDPNEIAATWNDYREGSARLGVGLSLDGGQSWDDFLVRPPAPYQSSPEGDPMTAYDNRTGALWVGAISFGSNGGVFTARKDHGSDTFEPVVMAEITGGADKGWMAAGPDPEVPETTRLYIAYNEGLLVSTDMGETYSGPDFIGNGGLGFLPRVGPAGELYIAYWDWNAWNEMAIVRSFDGGSSLSAPITVATTLDVWGVESTRVTGQYRVTMIPGFAVNPTDGTLYCAYPDSTEIVSGNYNLDVYFTRSTDQGTNWSTPVIISSDGDPFGDQFFPWIECDVNGRLHLLYFDNRTVAQDDIDENVHALIDAYYAYSDDHGDSWSEAVLTPAPFNTALDGFGGFFIGDYLGVSVGGDMAMPCYPSTQNGHDDVFVHRIVTGAEPIPGDLDKDGDVDLNDFATFALCYGGSAVTTPPPSCSSEEFIDADLDGDGDVDLADFSTFAVNYTG